MLAELVLVWSSTIVVFLALLWFVIDIRERREVEHIPGPRMYPVIGNLLEMFQIRRGVHEYFQSNRNKYGSIFRLRFVNSNFVIISDPDYVKTLLTSMENLHPPPLFLLFKPWLGDSLSMATGETWHEQRRMIDPMFTSSKLKQFVPSAVETCGKLCEDLERVNNGEIDLYSVALDMVTKLAYDNILGVMLDDPVYNDLQRRQAEYVPALDLYLKKAVRKQIRRLTYIILRRILRPWLWSDFVYSFTANGSRERELLKTVPNVTMQVILKKKRENPEEKFAQKNRVSFLDYFLEHQKQDPSMSDEKIREQTDSLIAGVMNTTGLSLFLTLYFIACDDSIQEKLREEINSTFSEVSLSKEASSEIMDRIPQLKYLDSLIDEALRYPKFPPVIGRLITQELSLGDYHIPVGTSVLIDTNAIHHDEKYYPMPNRYNPENFYNREDAEQKLRYTYLPFGAGLRRCIGERYMKMIVKLIIAHMVRNFYMEPTQSYEKMINSIIVNSTTRPTENTQKIMIKLRKIPIEK